MRCDDSQEIVSDPPVKTDTSSRVPDWTVVNVRAIRKHLDVSVDEMAKALGVSIFTLRSWEAGRRNPAGLATKVLTVIRSNPDIFRALAAH